MRWYSDMWCTRGYGVASGGGNLLHRGTICNLVLDLDDLEGLYE